MIVSIPGMLSEWDDVRSILANEIELAQAERSEVVSFLVAVEELVVNIISYAYGSSDQAGTQKITIVLDARKDNNYVDISCTLIDAGSAFNPLDHISRDPSDPASHEQAGGWGIFLAKSKVDEMEYCRKNNKNHLTLNKRMKYKE